VQTKEGYVHISSPISPHAIMSSQGVFSPTLRLSPEETRRCIEELVEVTPRLSRAGRRFALPAVSSVLLRCAGQRLESDLEASGQD